MPNPIADPMVEGPDSDLESSLVSLEAGADGVATVVINRPLARNAFNAEVIAALNQAFETLEGADGVRLVFVRGAGGTFSAGADLQWMRQSIDHTEADNRDDAMQLATMLKRLHDLPMLTVAYQSSGKRHSSKLHWMKGASQAGQSGQAASSWHNQPAEPPK